MNEKIEKYLNKVLITKSKGTYDYYICHSRYINNYCINNNLDFLSCFINKDVVINFIAFMKKSNISNETINKRLKVIEIIYKFYEINLKLDLLKKRKKRFDVIPEIELKKIINYVDRLPETNFNLNFKLTIWLLINTGIRANELVNIEKNNIDLENNCILLTITKINEDRIVYFKDNIKELIIKNLDLKSKSKYLLFNWTKQSNFTLYNLNYLIRNLKSHCNISHLHPHMFRHTFATLMIKHDCPVFPLMQLLGHKSVKTTERYIHQDVSNVAKAFNDHFNID